MMLQIGHRESRDVDIFCRMRNSCPFFEPKLHDFDYEIGLSDYGGDGTGFLKLAFEDVGEIDFIVGHAVTKAPTTRQTIEGEDVDLETVVEIIAKKIYYRGATIKPRDIFDIAAAASYDRDSLLGALRDQKDEVAKTLATIERLKPDFVNATIAELIIKDPFKSIADTALEEAKAVLKAV